jgi:hypothetical protein
MFFHSMIMMLIIDLGAPSLGHANRIRFACRRLAAALLGQMNLFSRLLSLLIHVKILQIVLHSPMCVDFSL